jgi:hypothetical protein
MRKTLTTPLLLRVTIWTRRFDAPSCSDSVQTGSNPSRLPSHLPISCHTNIHTSSACMCFCKLHGCLYIDHTSQDLGRRRPLQLEQISSSSYEIHPSLPASDLIYPKFSFLFSSTPNLSLQTFRHVAWINPHQGLCLLRYFFFSFRINPYLCEIWAFFVA